MINVITSGVVAHGFELPTSQTKDYKIDVCCFSAKLAALRRYSKDGSARNEAMRIMCPSGVTCKKYLNMTKIGYGHLCIGETNRSFNNNYII